MLTIDGSHVDSQSREGNHELFRTFILSEVSSYAFCIKKIHAVLGPQLYILDNKCVMCNWLCYPCDLSKSEQYYSDIILF